MAGELLNPAEMAQDWAGENMLYRIEQCRLILVCHEFITGPENERVKQRMRKWILARRVEEIDAARKH